MTLNLRVNLENSCINLGLKVTLTISLKELFILWLAGTLLTDRITPRAFNVANFCIYDANIQIHPSVFINFVLFLKDFILEVKQIVEMSCLLTLISIPQFSQSSTVIITIQVTIPNVPAISSVLLDIDRPRAHLIE